jgi:tryptophan synthase alpha chain
VASGFLYFVSVTGVTGARAEVARDLTERVAAVRAASPVPVVIGFGVSTPEQARLLGGLADGVVVGSAIVSRGATPGSRAAKVARVKGFVASLAKALRR